MTKEAIKDGVSASSGLDRAGVPERAGGSSLRAPNVCWGGKYDICEIFNQTFMH